MAIEVLIKSDPIITEFKSQGDRAVRDADLRVNQPLPGRAIWRYPGLWPLVALGGWAPLFWEALF